MSGLTTVTRRAANGSGRSRRNIYNGDFETESADHASASQPPTGGIFKNAAFEILKQEERLMTSGEITKLAMERKLLRCMGKTPENTMASALYTEVRKKASTTVFIKPKEGLFGLKAWLNEPWLLNWLSQEGIDPADVHDPGGAAEPVSKKLRTSYNGAASRGGGGGGNYSSQHRTSSNGTALLRSSSAGFAVSVGGAGGAAGTAGHRASLNGGPSSAGGGAAGRGAFANPAGLAAANGLQKGPYAGAGGRAGTANGMTGGPSGANCGSVAVSDALSSLHLLVDAADEIEGGPEDEPRASNRLLPGRRRSDGVLRQTSFRRQRPPLSRDTSLPSMIARVRVRDDLEDDLDLVAPGEADGDDGEVGEREQRDDLLGYTGDDGALRRDALRMLQLRQQSSNRLYQQGAGRILPISLQEPLQVDPHVLHPQSFPQPADLQQQQQYQQLQQRQYHLQQRGGSGARGRVDQAAGEYSDEEQAQHEGQEERDEEEHGQLMLDGTVEGPQQAEEDGGVGPRSGLYRSARGGGRRGDRGAAATGRARRGGGRGRGRGPSGPVRGEDSGDDEDEGQQVEEGEAVEDGSVGEDEEEEAQALLPPPARRRGPLPPRPSSDRRGGAAGGVRQPGAVQRCSSGGRLHTEVSLPSHMQMGQLPPHLGGSGFPVQMPLLQMPHGALGHGPYGPPLHLRQRMPPPGAGVGPGLPRGHPGAAGSIPAGGSLGLGVLPGMGLSQAQLGALLGPQAMGPMLGMGMGLGAGLSPMEMGPLPVDAAGGGGPCGYGLPPRLTKMATMLGRSPKLSAQLVAVQERIAALSGVRSEQELGDKVPTDGADVKGELGAQGEERRRSGGRRDVATDAMEADPCGGAANLRVSGCSADAPARRAPKTDSSPGPDEDCSAPGPCAGASARADGLASRQGLSDVRGNNAGAAAAASGSAPPGEDPSQPQNLPSASAAGTAAAAAAGGAVVAVHDAMNSPDSQVAGGGAGERASPAAAEDAGQSRSEEKAATASPAAAASDAAAAGQRGLGSASAAAAAAQGQQAMCPLSQLTLLQQQHLKLLLPVEPASPGDIPDPESVNRILRQVLEMESRMGCLHPETGRAYVLLARVLEHKGTCWSLTMAERALLRAWTIVGVVTSTGRRSSEAGGSGGGAHHHHQQQQQQQPAGTAAAVAGVVEAAAEEAPGEVLGQLPDSFHTFHYLLEQIRLKQAFLLDQQEQQLAGLLQMVAMVGANAAATLAAGPAGMGPGCAGGAAAAATLGSFIFGGPGLSHGVCGEDPYGPAGGMPM